jgi:hypothetical protein
MAAEWERLTMCESAITVEWEQLSVAGRYWATGEIRNFITEHHIQSAKDYLSREFKV